MDSAYYLNGAKSNTVSYNYDEGGVVKNAADGSVVKKSQQNNALIWGLINLFQEPRRTGQMR